jgi:heme/copper-type cytochrome/quinol oxidase subunit 3
MLYQQQTLLNKESKYKCFIIKQVPRCTLWRSDNTSGVTGNKLRSYYKRNNMVLPNEWFKLHYLYRKANNILWERAAVINEAHGWKYVKYLSWEKSTSHPFLIFESSRWPLLLSISAFLFITGLWYTLKNDGSLFPHGLLALSTLLYFKFSWINDLQKESNEGSLTIRVQKNMITGYKIFLFSEILVFFSCFWAFLNFGIVQAYSFVLMNFPPKGIVGLLPLGIPLANVLILLYSSLPLQAAQIWIKKGVRSRTLECVAQAIGSGVLFLYLQLKEYTTAFFTISDSLYGSGFYCTTGLHGFHVILGTLGFIILWFLVY